MTVAIVACGPGAGRCAIEGHFLKMNQGEFYLYSFDGTLAGIDTISVAGGRFDFEFDCQNEGIVVLVFPNYTELPLFVEPGGSIDIEADATQIKELKVDGSKDNKMMNDWRKETDNLTEAKIVQKAEQFIKEHPTSMVSQWLLYKHFISGKEGSLKKAKELAAMMQKENKESVALARLVKGLAQVSAAQKGDRLPAFTAVDINGRKVSSSDYMTGNAIITVWATWNYDGQNLNRRLKNKMESSDVKVKPKVLSICLDPSKDETRNTLSRDSLPWPVISDEKMFESPLATTLGLSSIPDNIVLKNGKIVGRHLDIDKAIEMATK